MRVVVNCLAMLRRLGQQLGPYLILEIFLPGGTVLALLLFLYKRKLSISSAAVRPGAEADEARNDYHRPIAAAHPVFRPPGATTAPGRTGLTFLLASGTTGLCTLRPGLSHEISMPRL